VELNSKNFDELLNLSKQYPLLSESRKNILGKMFSIATKERNTKKLIIIINNGSSNFPVLRKKINNRLFKLNSTITDRLAVYSEISGWWNYHKIDAIIAVLELLTTFDECQFAYQELIKSLIGGGSDPCSIYQRYVDLNGYDQQFLIKILAKMLKFDEVTLDQCDFVRQESIQYCNAIKLSKQSYLDSEHQNLPYYQRNQERQKLFSKFNSLVSSFVELEKKSLLKKIDLSNSFEDYLLVYANALSFKSRHPLYSQVLIETIFTKILQISNLDFNQCEFVWRESNPGSQFEKEAFRQQLDGHLAVTLDQWETLWTKLKSNSPEEKAFEKQMFDTFPNPDQKSDIILFFKANMTQNFKFTIPLSKALIH
jgi:hypothetical protein